MVAEDLPRATGALLGGRGEAVRVLAERDRVIDALYLQVEELAGREIPLQAPVAADLRFVRTSSAGPPARPRSSAPSLATMASPPGRGARYPSRGSAYSSHGHNGGSSAGIAPTRSGSRGATSPGPSLHGVKARHMRCLKDREVPASNAAPDHGLSRLLAQLERCHVAAAKALHVSHNRGRPSADDRSGRDDNRRRSRTGGAAGSAGAQQARHHQRKGRNR